MSNVDVDVLSAPFATPSSASTSPRTSVSEMPSFAVTGPNRLVTPRRTRTGAAPGGAFT